jgi:hypothetical protein
MSWLKLDLLGCYDLATDGQLKIVFRPINL